MLQLVGIAAMVIASRMLESDVMTIRESVWFTKNTYKYEDVVRMIPSVCMVRQLPLTISHTLKVMFASRGLIRSITHNDFVEMYCDIMKVRESSIGT